MILVGFGWLSDPLTAGDQTAVISRLLAWSCLSAAAIALIVAIYFTCRALTIREPPKESDLESEGDGANENPGPNHESDHPQKHLEAAPIQARLLCLLLLL